FYVFPIRPDRHSGLLFPQFQFGFNSQGGQFVRNAGYYWAPNDYMDATLSGDYYPSRPAWRGVLEGRYRVRDKVDGNFTTSLARDQGQSETRESDFQASHSQVLDDNTSLTAQANFTSSGDYTRDPLTGRPLANRINHFLVSSATLSRRWSWASLNLLASRRQDLDANPFSSPLPRLDEELPALNLIFPSRTIGHA